MSSLAAAPGVFALIAGHISTAGIQFSAQAGPFPTNFEPTALLLVQSSLSDMGLSRFVGLFFIGAIVVAFSVAMIGLWRYRRGLPAEDEALSQLEKNYEKVLPTQEKNPDVLKQQLLVRVDSDTAAAQRVVKLHSIRSQGGDFEQSPMAEVLATREAAKISFAKYVASILVLLGLCGAILGLSNLVFQMGPELRSMQELNKRSAGAPTSSNAGTAVGKDDKALDQSIDGLIDTMSNSLAHTWSAFIASLAGVIGSIVLLFYSWRVSQHQIKFLTGLEDLTAAKLIPIFKPPRELAELSGAVEAFKDASEYVSAVSSNLESTSARVEDSMRNFDDIVFKFRTGTETLQHSHERVYEAQSTITDLMNEFSERSKSIEGHLSKSQETIAGITEVLGHSDKRFDDAIAEWRRHNETLLQQIQKVAEQDAARAEKGQVETQKAIDAVNQLIKTNFTDQLKTLNAECLAQFKRQHDLNQGVLLEIVKEQKRLVSELQVSVNGNGNRELITGVKDFIKTESLGFTHVLDELKQETDVFRDLMQKFTVTVEKQRPEPIYDELYAIKALLTDIRTDLRREKAPTLVYANETDNSHEEKLLRKVGALNDSFRWLSSMLRTVLCLIGFTLPVLGLLGLTRKFDLWWVADWTGHEIYIGVIVAIGVLVAGVLVWISRPKDSLTE
jgi:hypothetical protein